ncbi:hypothetical protein AB0L41_36385 [Amycolatopsis mediterranei]|uniref:hypothetical protein n=1 Tax=Amycolatopsis mediterranei TaxID=33910 RepID=UPI00343DF2B6
MEIHCKARSAIRTVVLAFTAGAVLGAVVTGYAASPGRAEPPAHSAVAPSHG